MRTVTLVVASLVVFVVAMTMAVAFGYDLPWTTALGRVFALWALVGIAGAIVRFGLPKVYDAVRRKFFEEEVRRIARGED